MKIHKGGLSLSTVAAVALTVPALLVWAEPAAATPETPEAMEATGTPEALSPQAYQPEFEAPEVTPQPLPESFFEVTYPPRPKPRIDDIPPEGLGDNFRLVGHNPLQDDHLIPGLSPLGIPRGANGNIGAAAGPCVYVGSLAGSLPALVVDVSDPGNPVVVGPVPGHVPGIGHGIDAIDTIPDLNLMVIHMRPAVFSGFNRENATALQIYDISNCHEPRLVRDFPLGQLRRLGTDPETGLPLGLNTGMHMSTIWRDPEQPDRVLHLTTFLATGLLGRPDVVINPPSPEPGAPPPGLSTNVRPDGVDIRVVDLTGCPRFCNPRVVAEWGLEAELGLARNFRVTYPDGREFDLSAVAHQAALSVDGERMWVAQLGAGFFGLDSELLAADLPCIVEAHVVDDAHPAEEHCLKLLNPELVGELGDIFETETSTAQEYFPAGAASWIPPFYSGIVHTAANVPDENYEGDRTFVVVADEAATGPFVNCPWSWLRVTYTGERALGRFEDEAGERIPYQGAFFPRVLGAMAGAQNDISRCPTAESALPYGLDITRNDHGPHEPLIFPNLVIATYYSDGIKAYSMANPLMPVEIGTFINQPVRTVRFCWVNCEDDIRDEQGVAIRRPPDLSFGPVDARAFSRPIVKDGLVYYVDSNSGLYILEYTGPHADEIPEEGTCVTGNIHVAGFEPCPPPAG